jgi:hypothetical protein
VYVLIFIEMGSRRIQLAGCTMHPTATWVAQQARQLVWKRQDAGQGMRFVLHERDTKVPSSFDEVFASEGMEVMLTRLARPECQCLCGAVGTPRAGGMFGSPADPGMNATWITS